MKPKKDYSTAIVIAIIVFIAIVSLLASCEKPAEKYNWSCTIQEIRYYSNQKCPDTIYRYVYKEGRTQSQQLIWLNSIPTEEKIIFDGDTVLIKNDVYDCGKSLCW
jgi:hypothetical protein